MIRRRTIAGSLALPALCLALAGPAWAQDDPKAARPIWQATDLAGRSVQVPAAQQPTLILFIKAEQPQSEQALRTAAALLEKAGPLQAVAVFSGPEAKLSALKLTQNKLWPAAVVADPNYAISGAMSIRAWPSTELVLASGEKCLHIAGLPGSYQRDLAAHLAFATGKIDRPTLEKQLAETGLVEDDPQQVARRHLHLARQHLAQGQVPQAHAELLAGLKIQPENALLRLALADVQVTLGHPEKALADLESLPADAAPAWQLGLLRGRALVALGRGDEAATTLEQALHLNPDPAPAHYLLGLVHQQRGDWENAARAFRAAFEATAAGRQAAVTPPVLRIDAPDRETAPGNQP